MELYSKDVFGVRTSYYDLESSRSLPDVRLIPITPYAREAYYQAVLQLLGDDRVLIVNSKEGSGRIRAPVRKLLTLYKFGFVSFRRFFHKLPSKNQVRQLCFPKDLPSFRISSLPWWLRPIIWLGNQFYPIPLSKSAFVKHRVYDDSIVRFFTLKNEFVVTAYRSEIPDDDSVEKFERSVSKGYDSLEGARNAQLKVLTTTINEFLKDSSGQGRVVILGCGQNIHATCYYLTNALGFRARSSEWVKEPASL